MKDSNTNDKTNVPYLMDLKNAKAYYLNNLFFFVSFLPIMGRQKHDVSAL